nr:MAG TPA: hypothetical protein [Caudoviricetes sp.]DAZ83812.1 MAG TPA: hypothetical protein [Caudoviricetes sp.]
MVSFPRLDDHQSAYRSSFHTAWKFDTLYGRMYGVAVCFF